MSVVFQARAEGRGLTSAAFLGSSFGLGLGAIFLLAGLAPLAHTHFQAVRLAQESRAGLAETMLQRNINGKQTSVQRLVQTHDPMSGVIAVSDSAQAWPGRFGARLPMGRRISMLEAERDLDCLTEAVYFEARSESARGQAAVAQVVLNRMDHPNYPKTVCGVVFQGAAHPGCQFTFACDGSMRRPLEMAAWDRARRVAEEALAGVRVAGIGNATHYHTIEVQPYWGASMLRVAQVGLHVFYRPNPHWAAPREDQPETAVMTKLASAPSAVVKLVSSVPPKPAPVQPIAEPARAAETVAVPASETFSSSRAPEPAAS